MKNLIFIVTVVMISLQSIGTTKAQTNALTSDELKIFKEEVRHRVNRFQMYLTFIGSKKNDVATKQEYVKQTLKLFIGNGEDYKDIYDNIQPAVRMQVSSKKSDKKTWQRTKTYLNRLINLTYREVEITWADVCRVGEFHKVRDGLYVTTVTISQRFVGYRDSGSYSDTTDKSITVYLEEEVTTVGGRYRVLFGDIEVLETY